MVEERTEKLEGKIPRTKKEFEEHQKRLSELKSMSLGLLTGESQASFVEFCQVLGEIKNVLKRNEGVQISIAHSCLYGSPNWSGIIAYIERLFSKKKTSAEKTQFDLFCRNLPTPLKTIEEQDRVEFPKFMKELETAMRKFSKLMIEQEKANAEVVSKHVLANEQKKLTIEKHIEQREEEIEALQTVSKDMEIDELAEHISDAEPNFNKRLEFLKTIEKLNQELSELGTKEGEGFLEEKELESSKKKLSDLKTRKKEVDEGIGAHKEIIKGLKTKIAGRDKGKKQKMIEEKESSEKMMKELIDELKTIDSTIEELETAIKFTENFDASYKEIGEKMSAAMQGKEKIEKAITDNLEEVVKANIGKLTVEIAAARTAQESNRQQLLKFPKPSEELTSAHKEVCACFLEIMGSAVGIMGKSRDIQEGLLKIGDVEEKAVHHGSREGAF